MNGLVVYERAPGPVSPRPGILMHLFASIYRPS